MHQRIYIVLNDYFGAVLSQDEIHELASKLDDAIFEFDDSIPDILSIIENHPSQPVKEAKESLLLEIVELMDDCPSTANRLYKYFMEVAQSPEIYMKLMNDNHNYLSLDQLVSLKKKASELYDPEFLEFISDYYM